MSGVDGRDTTSPVTENFQSQVPRVRAMDEAGLAGLQLRIEVSRRRNALEVASDDRVIYLVN